MRHARADRLTPADVLVLLAICLASLVGFLIGVALSPFFPVIAADLRTTVALLGQVPAISMLAAGALGLASGPLADHYGYRRLLLVGSLAVVVSALGTALAPTVAVLLAAALCGAVSRAIVQPVSLAIAGTHFDGAARRRAVSWVVASVAGAGIVGVPALTSSAAAFGWRAAFLALAALALVIALLASWAAPPDRLPDRDRLRVRAVVASYAPLLRHPPTLGLLGAALLRNAGIWCVMTYLSAYLVERHGLGLQAVGWAYTGLGLGFFVGSLVVGGKIGRLPLRPVLIATTVAQAVSITGPFLLPVGLVAALAVLGLGTLLAGVSTVAGALLLAGESPAGQATTMTLNQAGFSVGIAAGSAAGGLLLALGGYPALAIGGLGFSVSGALLVWLVRPRAILVAAPGVPAQGVEAAAALSPEEP